jgi:cell division protein ZapA
LSKRDRPEIVEIEIFEQRYPLRLASPAQKDEIQEVAAEVDRRMREIARQSGTVDSLKVAILTALHLAEESRHRDTGSKKLETSVRSGARKWIAAIEKELEGTDGR